MRELRKGENMPVADPGQLVFTLAQAAEVPVFRPEMSALVLRGDSSAVGRELVSRNAPAGADGAVYCALRDDTVVSVTVRPGQLATDVERILVVGSLNEGTLAAATGLRLAVADSSGGPIAEMAIHVAGGESAVVLAELYRSQGIWKLRAVSQGYASGLAGLLRDWGVSAGVSTEKSVPQDSAGIVSLREQHELGTAPIRVTLVVHHWPELEPLFDQGTIREMVDRVADLARVCDPSGAIDVWICGDDVALLPPMPLREADFWWKQWYPVLVSGDVPPVGGPQPAPVRIDFYTPEGLPHDPDPRRAVRHDPYFSGSSGCGTVPSVTARHVESATERGLVFVLSPGFVYKRTMSLRLVDAAESPVFWYFLDYGVERPSAFAGIRHWKTKNYGFAVVDDFENWDDPTFHDTVLTEFADWWTVFHTGHRDDKAG